MREFVCEIVTGYRFEMADKFTFRYEPFEKKQYPDTRTMLCLADRKIFSMKCLFIGRYQFNIKLFGCWFSHSSPLT